MARLWTCGFELQSVTAGVEILSVTGTPTISTTVHRAGAASLRINPTAATQYVEQQIDPSGTVKRTLHRFYLRITTLPSATTAIYAVGQSGYFPAHIRLSTTGTLRLFDSFSGTDLGTASAALSTGVWYRIELDHTDTAGTAGTVTGAFIGYIDGVNFSGSTLVSNINGFSRVRAGFQTAATGEIHIDDIAVNDTTGSAQTGLPGPGNVVHLHPDSAGDNAGWATTVGGSSNWGRVSEVAPDDATTYNATTATGTTTIDDHNMGSTSAAGVSGQRVTLVAVGGRIGSNAVTAASLVYRIKSQASGTVLESASVSVALNGWASQKAAAPYVYQLTSYTDPQAGGAWTTALLDAAQIGYRSNVSQSTARRVSALWALVETVPVTTAALGIASEIDTGQALSRVKTRAPGVSTETDAAQPLTRRKTKALGTALETDAGQTLTGRRIRAASVVAETDTAQSLTWRRSQPLGIASEVDSAQAPGHARARALPLAAAVDTGQALARTKRQTLATVSETAAAQPLAGTHPVILGVAAETDTGQDVGRRKTRAMTTAAATETAQPLAGTGQRTLPTADETGSALSFGRAKRAALALAGATEQAQPLTGRRSLPLGIAAETAAARPLGTTKSAPLPTAAETTAAVPLAPASGLVAAEETNAARPLGRAKTTTLGVAGEVGQAQPFGRARARGLTGAVETATARPLTGGRSRALELAEETWTARLLGQSRARQLPTADESSEALTLAAGAMAALAPGAEADTARPVTGSKTQPLTGSSVVEAAQPVTGRKTRMLGVADEVSTVRPLASGKRRPMAAAVETAAAQRLLIPGAAAPAEETSTARPLTGAKLTALVTVEEVAEAQQFGTQAMLQLGRAAEVTGAGSVGRRKTNGLTPASGFEAARPVTGTKRCILGAAGEVSRALIGPTARLTQAIDRHQALALVGHRQQPADHLDATARGSDLTLSVPAPALAAASSGPTTAASSSGSHLVATTT